ncbi:class I SAM-dependent methyltransferase [Candidatus Bathyarchaeota archaeon]|nr:MAG: class I SAM-dependent methyltransferase [Candidatus Bathyarchaeota archaeon]
MARTLMRNIVPVTKSCRVCHSGRLVRVLSLGNQYVSDFVTAAGRSPRSPLDLVRCRECGLVQLDHTFPRDSLYRRYWYKSGISESMRNALKDVVVQACNTIPVQSGNIVLDIGCNDGTLLRQYGVPGLRLIGFEPARNLVKEARKGTEFIFNDFFSFEAFRRKFGESRAVIMTSIAMFYDLDDPNSFVDDVAKTLDPNGIWVIQQNYLPAMLKNNGFDNIGHEHLTYFSLRTLTRLMNNHGMKIFHVETNEANGGSFRAYICHGERFPIRESVRAMTKYEHRIFERKPSIYKSFARNIREIRVRLRRFITYEVKAGKRVYVYGASTRGNTILQYCGLDYRLIKKATDANPEKWGRKTVGTLIPIVSKEEARRDRPDYFLILPHHFLQEIAAAEAEYLERGGKFIVPLPNFRILSRR